MYNPSIFLTLLLAFLFASPPATGAPTREALVAAWEAKMLDASGTVAFEKTGEDRYRFEDQELPYAGELRIVNALVRSAQGAAGLEGEFTHAGMVEFELVDLAPERHGTQSYYYWLGDRNTLYYSETEGAWLGATEYNDAMIEQYGGGLSLGALQFLLNYGFWIVLIGLLVFTFVAIGRHNKKAHSLMDESASINAKAKENLDRGEKMQEEVLAIARETRDLQAQSIVLLREMLEVLKAERPGRDD